MIEIEKIRGLTKGRIEIGGNVGMYTSFKTGGTADLLVEPRNVSELESLVKYLMEVHAPYMIIGNGTNVLVSDEGYRGVAIHLKDGFQHYTIIKGTTVEAGAGIRLPGFVNKCIDNGFQGYEKLAGIPGTLGGAIIMNAGAYGVEIKDYLESVTVLRNGECVELPSSACGFRYRGSELTNDIVISARFTMNAGDREEMRTIKREYIKKRNEAQPIESRNAGSIFRNPENNFAGMLIEQAGLKGFRAGGAEVSQKHANFIVCDHTAQSGDVIQVINEVRQRVYAASNIILELEIQLVGFHPGDLKPVE